MTYTRMTKKELLLLIQEMAALEERRDYMYRGMMDRLTTLYQEVEKLNEWA